jgi:polyisoprenoid-binding protein YceI
MRSLYLGLCLGFASTGTHAADYQIDPSHAFIQFRISHLGYSTVVGRFNQFQGDFSWDKSAPTGAKVALKIDPSSIDTNWAERDKHLKSAEFLDVAQFPEASFVSTGYSGDASGGTLTGNLTLHGVTRPVTLKVTAIGEGSDPWGGYRAGFSGTTEITRSDFGISYDLGPSAERMNFDLYLEGIRK